MPVAFILYYIYNKDREKEPVNLLIKCLLGGVIIVPLVIGLEFLFDYIFSFILPNSHLIHSIFSSYFVALLVEELMKFLVMYLIIKKTKDFNQYFDGIVYAVFVSLGFASIENILFIATSDYVTSILRAILAVPAHAIFGVAMGYYFSFATLGNLKHRQKMRF